MRNMKVVAIIQARMGSSRLPGKVLKDLGGKSVLTRVVTRVRQAERLDNVLVATSDQPGDDVIADECARLSVPCFRGNEADVLDRYYQAAVKVGADAIVRVTADCPLIDPELIDSTVEAFLDRKADYATNALVVTYPPGLDVEAVTFAALDCAWRSAKEAYQRTHVTPYFYENPGQFKIVSLTADGDYSKYRWTLDTPEDLELIRSVYRQLGQHANFRWRDVLRLMEDQPELAEVNSHVRQKSLHEG
jgi:spore coat polysaccharide biosynthesis protein SpsF